MASLYREAGHPHVNVDAHILINQERIEWRSRVVQHCMMVLASKNHGFGTDIYWCQPIRLLGGSLSRFSYQYLILWDQDTDFMHPNVTRFQHPESRKSLIRLERGARPYLNRAIMSRGAFAVIYGLHLKYYMKDPEEHTNSRNKRM